MRISRVSPKLLCLLDNLLEQCRDLPLERRDLGLQLGYPRILGVGRFVSIPWSLWFLTLGNQGG